MARPRHSSGNLPAETSTFVGRKQELTELKAALAKTRLLTLVGPGGVGKSRLAIRLAAEVERIFSDGAWLATLAEVSEPDLVPKAVLKALDLRDQSGVAPRELVIGNLRDKQLLLVVDNCEHLLDACASLVQGILTAAPRVKLIVTSREPLSADGERVVPVPPLAHEEAIALMLDRAAAVAGEIEPTDVNRRAVAELCDRLDGLPLAIELAAVRTRALSVQQILEGLTDRFSLLTGGRRAGLHRHQTLSAAIGWSYDMLSEAERSVMRRLSVFAGTFSLDDAYAVCSEPGVSEGEFSVVLASLVGRSLVIRKQALDVSWYALHETMREYGALRLREAGDDAYTLDRFTAYYMSVCERSCAEARTRALYWLARMDAELDNVRALIQQFVNSGDNGRALEVAGYLDWYWVVRATAEGTTLLDSLLVRPEADASALASAYMARGQLALGQLDTQTAESAFTQCALYAAKAGNQCLQAAALVSAVYSLDVTGRHTDAVRVLSEAKSLLRTCQGLEAHAAFHLSEGFSAIFEGDIERALVAYKGSIELWRRQDHLYGLALGLAQIALTFLQVDNVEDSSTYTKEGLPIALAIDNRTTLAYLLDAAAYQSAAADQARVAARLQGAAEQMREELGARLLPLIAPIVDRASERAMKRLGPQKFEAEFGRGRRLTRQEAVAVALGEPLPPPSRASVQSSVGFGLGRRESEVAALVAEGLTNKEIGARLFIGDRTVESYVRGIMDKLGFNSRAQIASWVMSHTSLADGGSARNP